MQTIQLDQLGAHCDSYLDGIVMRVLEQLPKMVENIVKPEVKRNCPTPEEEIRILTRGIGAHGESGTGSDNRFIRGRDGVDGVPIVDAIGEEMPILVGNGVRFGNARRMNERTIFGWRRRMLVNHRLEFGEVRTTEPFNHRYLEAMEEGGTTWIVVPRPGTTYLNPEGFIRETAMVKQTPTSGFHMFFRATTDSGVRSAFEKAIKGIVEQESNG